MSKINAQIRQCEICGMDHEKALERHHILPRTSPNTSNDPEWIAVICGNCHTLTHACEIVIEGRYMTSGGSKLFFHRKGQPYVMRPGIILHSDGTAIIKEEP